MRAGSKSGYTKKAIDQWSQMIRQRFDKVRDKIAEKAGRGSGIPVLLLPVHHIVGIPVGRCCCWVEIGRCGLFHV
jgi:hypothetical protein